MPEAKETILIVEDDIDIAEMLANYFRVQGYEILSANWGEDGVAHCQTHLPNLVILDIRLPDIDGYEVARRLKANRRTHEIPIIFLTERRTREDRIKGLELKAEDFITKPFDIQELRLRVRNALRRTSQGSLNNPVTGLPEGPLVDERLTEIAGKQGWAVILVSLVNLERFREVYGFVASDDLLRAVSLMLRDTMSEFGGPNDFVGHITPTTFILVIDPANRANVKDMIRKRIEQSLDYFYKDQDRRSEKFRGKNLSLKIDELDQAKLTSESAEKIKDEIIELTRGA